MYFGTKSYGLDGHVEHHGSGANMYRGEDFGQPRTLRDGDVLANGLVVSGKPYEGFNGSIGLNFSNGSHRLVAARLPLQLRSDRLAGVLPRDLQAGQILQTGDVVLSEPKPIGRVDWHDGQDEVEVRLTGGWYGHAIGVASDLPLAVFHEMYPPSTTTPLGAFALEQVLGMKEEARANLPQLGQLVFEVW